MCVMLLPLKSYYLRHQMHLEGTFVPMEYINSRISLKLLLSCALNMVFIVKKLFSSHDEYKSSQSLKQQPHQFLLSVEAKMDASLGMLLHLLLYSLHMETLRPALYRLYMTRASAYRDALISFIQGYQEGVKSGMEQILDTNLKMQDNVLRKDTWL